MSLVNQNWLTFGGEPITGMTPTRLIVYPESPGLVMNAAQEGFVSWAYKQFCDDITLSAHSSGFHVKTHTAPDGTHVRMESNNGVHKVQAWISGAQRLSPPESYYWGTCRYHAGGVRPFVVDKELRRMFFLTDSPIDRKIHGVVGTDYFTSRNIITDLSYVTTVKSDNTLNAFRVPRFNTIIEYLRNNTVIATGNHVIDSEVVPTGQVNDLWMRSTYTGVSEVRPSTITGTIYHRLTSEMTVTVGRLGVTRTGEFGILSEFPRPRIYVHWSKRAFNHYDFYGQPLRLTSVENSPIYSTLPHSVFNYVSRGPTNPASLITNGRDIPALQAALWSYRAGYFSSNQDTVSVKGGETTFFPGQIFANFFGWSELNAVRHPTGIGTRPDGTPRAVIFHPLELGGHFRVGFPYSFSSRPWGRGAFWRFVGGPEQTLHIWKTPGSLLHHLGVTGVKVGRMTFTNTIEDLLQRAGAKRDSISSVVFRGINPLAIEKNEPRHFIS